MSDPADWFRNIGPLLLLVAGGYLRVYWRGRLLATIASKP